MRIPHGLRVAAGASRLPDVNPGDSYEGGYFAGFISQTGDGNATHGLIIAPAASGYNGGTKLQWKTTSDSTTGTGSSYDGAANTANMSNTSHPAANYCANLSINGYTDWYLPARYELEIAYYNLKPTTTNNVTDSNTDSNPYAYPAARGSYTTSDPSQTSVSAFQSGGTEAFEADDHWTSTQRNQYTA